MAPLIAEVRTGRDMARAFRFPEKDVRQELKWVTLAVLVFLVAMLLLSLFARRARRRRTVITVRSDNPRRADFRVHTDLPAELFLKEGAPSAPGRIFDLSAGGALVILDQEVATRTRFWIRFVPDAAGPLDLLAEVVRSDASPLWGNRFHLHCRFADLTVAQEQRLLRTVAERERARGPLAPAKTPPRTG